MKAPCTDYSPSPLRQPPSPLSLWSPPCAKNYQYLLNASHKACPWSCTGLTGRGEDIGEAIMRCPERFLCTCARAADVAARAVPGDRPLPFSTSVLGISSADRERTQTQTSSDGESRVGDARGKSSLLWIVIIGLLTSPRACACVVHCVIGWDVFVGLKIIYSSLEYLLLTPLC